MNFFMQKFANLEFVIYFCNNEEITYKLYMKKEKSLTLKTLNKSNIWDVQENDIFRMWEAAEKDADLKDNQRHYMDVIKSAFDLEIVKIDKPEVIKNTKNAVLKLVLLRSMMPTKINGRLRNVPSCG